MAQPLSHADLRRKNLALLMDHLLRRKSWTRKEIEQESGLSKATVSRLVNDLIRVEALRTARAPDPEVPARGRRTEILHVPSELGVVIGLNLGLHRTDMVVLDLVGNELASHEMPTPRWKGKTDAIEWATTITERALVNVHAPLLHMVVSVPARIDSEHAITQLPPFMNVLEGNWFAQQLSERLSCPVRIALDAAMMLAGFETLGIIDESSAPVLLNLGSVVTMSLRRRDGSIAGGSSAAFGDFNLIPVETSRGTWRAGQILSAHGMFEASRQLGCELQNMSELWNAEPHDPEQTTKIGHLKQAFFDALVHTIRVIIVMADPRVIVFTGRLAPLAAQFLTEPSVERLRDELQDPPRFEVVDDTLNGRAAAFSSGNEALQCAVNELLEELSEAGLDVFENSHMRSNT